MERGAGHGGGGITIPLSILVEVVAARVFPTVTLAQAGEFVECSRVLLSTSVLLLFLWSLR